MLIPIRCMSCGKPIGHLFKKYKQKLAKKEKPKKALDDLGLERFCCRSIFLSHEDFIDVIAKFKKS